MRPSSRRDAPRLRAAWCVWLLSAACGEPSAPPPEPTTASATQWRAHARRQLLRESCRAGGRLRRCAGIDRDRCEHLMVGALARCTDLLAPGLPARIEVDDRGRLDQWQGCAWHHVGITLLEGPQPLALDLPCLMTPG